MLVPDLSVNLGIITYKQFLESFFTLIQDDPDHTAVELNFEYDEADVEMCGVPNDVYTESRVKNY